ncbi:MAG: type II toxin-antitoxin system RelE/ParE family toxin [Bacteroidetes bacterium]|nr:type II toxin-antitoxin system RelE/ParE family toxin [Bacteroidota bacterium]
MKKHYKVVWDDEAKASLRNIYHYIKNRESLEQSRKVRDEIKELAKSLGFMPHKYTEDAFLTNETGDNRFKVIWSYKLVYEIQEETIVILDIFHTSRDPQNLKRKKE